MNVYCDWTLCNDFHLNITKKILQIGNEQIFLETNDEGDISMMGILVSEDVHISGKIENMIKVRLAGKPRTSNAGIIGTND